MSLVKNIRKDFQKLIIKEKVEKLQQFFKTGKGEYGEGDVFIGIKVPDNRKLVCKYKNEIDLNDLQIFLNSKVHEERLFALLVLIEKYNQSKDKKSKTEIYNFYINNFKNINNWDLVDSSAHKILGVYLLEFSEKREILKKWAKSSDLWVRRISILTTFQFIYNGESEWTFKIAKILLSDEHHLIHKAVGWMLREVGKKISQTKEEEFLKKYYQQMPRTMLRYAIERFDKEKRSFYMK